MTVTIKSPVEGKVQSVLKKSGETVNDKDTILLIITGAKTEHTITASQNGTVTVDVKEGDIVKAEATVASIN